MTNNQENQNEFWPYENEADMREQLELDAFRAENARIEFEFKRIMYPQDNWTA